MIVVLELILVHDLVLILGGLVLFVGVVLCQVARGDILTYFNQIFVGLCKLFADVDVDVKNGSNLLDRLIKVRCGTAVWCGVVWRVRLCVMWRHVIGSYGGARQNLRRVFLSTPSV